MDRKHNIGPQLSLTRKTRKKKILEPESLVFLQLKMKSGIKRWIEQYDECFDLRKIGKSLYLNEEEFRRIQIVVTGLLGKDPTQRMALEKAIDELSKIK